MCLCSLPVGPDLNFFFCSEASAKCIYCVCELRWLCPAYIREYAHSAEPSLVTYVISTLFTQAGSNTLERHFNEEVS